MFIDFIFPGTKKTTIRATLSYETSSYLGCHANVITYVAVSFKIKEDPDKELKPQEPFMTGLTEERRNVCREYLINNKEERYKLFAQLRDMKRSYSLVVMSAACNTDDGKPDRTVWVGKLSTAGFAEYLREQGEFIMATPLLSNSNHQRNSFSLVRGWFWIPTHSWPTVKHIEGTEYISGKMQSGLPFDEWVEHYKKFHSDPKTALLPGGVLKEFSIEELTG